MADRTPADSTHLRPLALVPPLDQDQIATPESVPLTSFIGRTTEISVVVALLLRPEVRLLTLTGPGGIDKTRLALRVVETVRDTAGEASAWVSLAPVRDPELVLPTIAQALDVLHAAGESLLEQIRAYLQERRLLLVLDTADTRLASDHYPVVLESRDLGLAHGGPNPLGETGALRIVDGSIEGPDRPGMGIEFNIEAAKARLAPEDAAFFD